MAVVKLGEPPKLLGSGHQRFKPWLLEAFFDQFCSYCVLRSTSLDVDHYEPRKFRPERIEDPTNLLLACPRCNDPGGKWDYHPQHAQRKKRPNDKTGFLILDPRTDNFGQLFQIEADGRIDGRPGAERDRARWNVALLKLDLLDEDRQELLDLRDVLEQVIRSSDADDIVIRDRLLPSIARRLIFYEVFDLELSKALREAARAERTRLRAQVGGPGSATGPATP